MKNKKMFENIADDAARKATVNLYKELEGTAKQIASDQVEWLDDQMRSLLPPMLYDAGKRLEKQEEIGQYLRKHGISIVFVPDRQSIEIHIKGQKYTSFETRILVDGEPIQAAQQFLQN